MRVWMQNENSLSLSLKDSMSITERSLSAVLEIHSLSLRDIPHEELVSIISLPYEYQHHYRLVTFVSNNEVYVYRVRVAMLGGIDVDLLCTTPLYEGDDTRP